jgi:hypothetical protein
MANAAPTTNPSRRLFLAAGTAVSVFGALSATMLAGVPATAGVVAHFDPVLAALDRYAQARADYELAVDDFCRIEREHHAPVSYQPRVKIGQLTIFARDGNAEVREDVFAKSEAEIMRDSRRRPPENIEMLKAELKADEARRAAELKRVGFYAAGNYVVETSKRLSAAESSVLQAVPATNAGAHELARFAANRADDDSTDDLGTAFRTLYAWLINQRQLPAMTA